MVYQLYSIWIDFVIHLPIVQHVLPIEVNDIIVRGVMIFKNVRMVTIVLDNNGFVHNVIVFHSMKHVRILTKIYSNKDYNNVQRVKFNYHHHQ